MTGGRFYMFTRLDLFFVEMFCFYTSGNCCSRCTWKIWKLKIRATLIGHTWSIILVGFIRKRNISNELFLLLDSYPWLYFILQTIFWLIFFIIQASCRKKVFHRFNIKVQFFSLHKMHLWGLHIHTLSFLELINCKTRFFKGAKNYIYRNCCSIVNLEAKCDLRKNSVDEIMCETNKNQYSTLRKMDV